MDLVADGGWRMADGEWLSEELTAHIGIIIEKRLLVHVSPKQHSF